jgi:hypothetical protein
MSSMTSPRPQPNVRDETSEYEEMQRELRPAYTAEHRTMYSPSTSTPSTVRSVSREQVDRESASANMAIQPSIMGSLTDEQKQARDRHRMNRTLFGNYLIDAQEERQFRRELSAIASSARTAYKEPSFDGHQAMPAIIAQDDEMYDNRSTPLTQRGLEKRRPRLPKQRKSLWLKCQLKPTKKKYQLYSPTLYQPK